MKDMVLWFILAELQTMNHSPRMAALSAAAGVVMGITSLIKAVAELSNGR